MHLVHQGHLPTVVRAVGETHVSSHAVTVPVLVDPPHDSLLMRITSPGFEAPPPDIIHPERIPPDIWSACAAQREGGFAPRPVSVWLLHDVHVACEGLVFDRDGRLYRPSVTQHGPAEIDWAASAVCTAQADGSALVHDLPLVLGKKRGAANYGHWLMEMLPMLHLVLSRLSDPAVGVLLHDVTDPRLGEVIQTSVSRLGIAPARVRISDHRPVRVRTLLLVEGLTTHGTYMSPLVRDCHVRLAHDVPGHGHRRVFVARGPDRARDFTDPAAAEAVARDAGYHVLHPDRLSFLEQVATIRDAEVVAGAMGAALTTLAYLRNPATVLIFAGAAMPDTFFWFIATLFGHHYREIRCLQSDAPAPTGVSYDRALLIDPSEMRRLLAVS